ncbi:MAG: hypothetical protein ACI4TI_02020 [Christensenellales bacterium]
MKKINISLKKRYKSFMFLVVAICTLGAIFGVSYAYLSGTFSNNSLSNNPYVLLEYYYNDGTTDYKIDKGGISGSVSANGTVSLTVRSGSTTKTITQSANAFALPIKIKNSGNVDGVVSSIQLALSFQSGSNNVAVDNSCGHESYFLQMLSSNYQIQNNCEFVLPDAKISLSAKGANSQTILNSLKVDTNIADSDLCGKNFKINIICAVTQTGFEDLRSEI